MGLVYTSGKGILIIGCAYIKHLSYAKVFGGSIPVARQHVLVLTLQIPHQVVSRLLALALCQSPVDVTEIPLLLLNRNLRGLQGDK